MEINQQVLENSLIGEVFACISKGVFTDSTLSASAEGLPVVGEMPLLCKGIFTVLEEKRAKAKELKNELKKLFSKLPKAKLPFIMSADLGFGFSGEEKTAILDKFNAMKRAMMDANGLDEMLDAELVRAMPEAFKGRHHLFAVSNFQVASCNCKESFEMVVMKMAKLFMEEEIEEAGGPSGIFSRLGGIGGLSMGILEISMGRRSSEHEEEFEEGANRGSNG